MTGQGSTGNVIAAICSFFIPGLGQLVQGRVLRAIFMFLSAGLLYFFWWLMVTWIVAALIHLWSIIDAATYKGD